VCTVEYSRYSHFNHQTLKHQVALEKVATQEAESLNQIWFILKKIK